MRGVIPGSLRIPNRSAFARIAGGDSRGLDIKALQGREGFRLGFGDYCAICGIDGEQINVLVLDAGPLAGKKNPPKRVRFRRLSADSIRSVPRPRARSRRVKRPLRDALKSVGVVRANNC